MFQRATIPSLGQRLAEIRAAQIQRLAEIRAAQMSDEQDEMNAMRDMPQDSDSDDDVPLSQRAVEFPALPRQALFVNPDALLRHRREREAAQAAPAQAAPAQAAPVQEAARVANPRLQRLHVPRCAGVPTLEWLSFVKYVIEEGFGFVEHDMHGAVYERVRE